MSINYSESRIPNMMAYDENCEVSSDLDEVDAWNISMTEMQMTPGRERASASDRSMLNSDIPKVSGASK